MKKIRNLCFGVIGMIALMANSCDKDKVNPEGCYQFSGKVISQDCPSSLTVNVNSIAGQNFGDTLTWVGVFYSNLVVIENNPGTFKNGDVIYFNVDPNADSNKCGNHDKICHDIIYLPNLLKTHICISNSSYSNCNSSDK